VDPDGDFGEDRRHEAHLIPIIFHIAVGRRPKVLLYGGDYPTRHGSCVRDYVHTADLAQAHQLASRSRRGWGGPTTSARCRTGVTVLEVLRACEEVIGRPIAHEIVDRRPGDPAVLIASPAKTTASHRATTTHSQNRNPLNENRIDWGWTDRSAAFGLSAHAHKG
jgi:UDP-glucose 4-epimerase